MSNETISFVVSSNFSFKCISIHLLNQFLNGACSQNNSIDTLCGEENKKTWTNTFLPFLHSSHNFIKTTIWWYIYHGDVNC